MVQLWEQGNEVVLAKRTARQGEGYFKRSTAAVFYRLLNCLSATNIPQDIGDYRLIDRKVANGLSRCDEHNPFVRGLVSWVGYRQVAVEYVRGPRWAGKTKYPLRKMMAFAWDGIISFSDKPLRIASTLGFLAILVAFLVLLYGLYRHATGETVRGWTSTLVTILFLGGIQLFAVGVIGEYLSRIYDDIKRRPLYIVAEDVNFETTERGDLSR
jgi:dolichol-phosphate mannosyltransferase